ncbi:hypothetical protein [Streptomyces sp. NRRL B-3229]|uniref:hypothetical protein n=1 Tax=Streptomyces sp. NRRL B-3229 TaxID=1463836 RepID=UPI0004C20479|nr:hypothetical protein [Streptomyces sp. NRRL B-3229]
MGIPAAVIGAVSGAFVTHAIADDSGDTKAAEALPSGSIQQVAHVSGGKVVVSGTIKDVPVSATLWSFVQDTNGNYFPNFKPCEIHKDGTWDCPELRLAGVGDKPSDNFTVHVALINGEGGMEIEKHVEKKRTDPKASMDGLPEGSTPIADQQGIR